MKKFRVYIIMDLTSKKNRRIIGIALIILGNIMMVSATAWRESPNVAILYAAGMILIVVGIINILVPFRIFRI